MKNERLREYIFNGYIDDPEVGRERVNCDLDASVSLVISSFDYIQDTVIRFIRIGNFDDGKLDFSSRIKDLSEIGLGEIKN